MKDRVWIIEELLAHHPSIQPALNFVLLIQFRITQGDGAYASWHWMRGTPWTCCLSTDGQTPLAILELTSCAYLCIAGATQTENPQRSTERPQTGFKARTLLWGLNTNCYTSMLPCSLTGQPKWKLLKLTNINSGLRGVAVSAAMKWIHRNFSNFRSIPFRQ